MADDSLPDSPTWSPDRAAQAAIEAKSHPEPNSGCWLWTRAVNDRGYGWFHMPGSGAYGRSWAAHRASYLAYRGPIPAGLFVCHRCDTPACVNPNHLWLGDHDANMADRNAKGRLPFGLRAGVHTRPDKKRLGSLHGMSRLTDDEAQFILDCTTMSNRSLADRFSVDISVVQKIKARKLWKHLRKTERADAS